MIETIAIVGSGIAIVATLVCGPQWSRLWLLTILGVFALVAVIVLPLALL